MKKALLVAIAMAGLAGAVAAQAGVYSLSGVVKDADGVPAASVWVVLLQDETIIGKSLTGDDGTYYIEVEIPGIYRLGIAKDGSSLPAASEAVTVAEERTSKNLSKPEERPR